MIYKSLNLKSYQNDGRRERLPSVFPFYDQSERDTLFALSESDRVDRLAQDLKVNVDEGDSITVCLCENLFIADLTFGGKNVARFSNDVSPFFMSAVIEALSQMDLGKEKVVLGVPNDKGLIISAYLLKEMGFPIEKVVIPSSDDVDGEHFCFVDVSLENYLEYLADFYDDFDFLFGIEDAKTSLALDIYTDGFEKKTLLVNCFGFNESLIDCHFALTGKRKNERDSARWIEENCALSISNEKSLRKVQYVDKNLMKELCNLPKQGYLFDKN